MKILPGRLIKGISVFFNSQMARNQTRLLALSPPLNENPISLNILSICSEQNIQDQFASMYSFWKHVGRPISWKCISDGSISKETQGKMEKYFPFLSVVDLNDFLKDSMHLADLMKVIPEGLDVSNWRVKKLFLLWELSHQNVLFCDSDILFYPEFKHHLPLFENSDSHWFSANHDWGFLDAKYLENKSHKMYGINSGFTLFNGSDLDKKAALSYISDLDFVDQFLDQTVMQIWFDTNKNIQVLNPIKFTTMMSDHFSLALMPGTFAMRHFVRPVRHKLWQSFKQQIL
ncbi:MAG: hypothetical protein ACI9YL_000077 [Luteibaculaceae bacterium]|jgi:hypothetical protein